MPSSILLLLRVFDQAFRAPAWHGTPLWGTLRGVTPREALRRPAPGRHNIWELVLHTAYWKYVVRRRLTRDETLTFPRDGSNWLAVPVRPNPRAWKADLALLREEHRLLRRVIARFPAAQLKRRGWRSKWTNEEHIYGIASHDLYHAGQIQLIKRFVR
jgi:DinB family protein